MKKPNWFARTAKAAILALSAAVTGAAWAEEINVINVPELTVTTLDPADDSLDWRGQLTPINVALHYELSADVLAAHQEEFAAIANWKIDWVLTSSEDLTLVNPRTALPSGMTLEQVDASSEGGCISGKISEASEWVYAPLSSPGVFQLSANTGYRVYNQIVLGGGSDEIWLDASSFVQKKGFGCSLYLTTAYRMAHPNVVITLQPYLYHPSDSSVRYSLGEAKRFTFGLPDAPKAVVTKNAAYNKEVNLVNVNGILSGGYQYGTVTPNVAYTFEAKDTSDEASSGAYSNWKCDYIVSMDADTDAYSIGLFGQYGWGAVAFPSPVDAKAGQKIPLLMSVTKNGWNYSDIVRMVRSFTCGAINFSEENIGKTITVSLVMWNEDNPVYKSYENPYVVEEIKYKFETVTPLFASVSQGVPAVPVVYRKNTADEYGFSVDENGYPVVDENNALVIKSFNVGEPHFAMVADNAIAKTSDSSYSTADEAVATVEDNKEITVNVSTSIGSEAAPAGSTVTTTTGTAVTAGTDSAAETTVTPKTVTIMSGTGSEQTGKTVEAYVVSQGSGDGKKFSVVTDVSKDETIVSAGKTVVSDFVKPAAVIANAVASENLAADKVSSMVLSLVKTEAESSEPGLGTALVTAIGAADKAFEVHPVATITTTTEEGATATTSYAVANSELAEDASFTFTLDFGAENAGKFVTLTHYAKDGTVKKHNGKDSWTETLDANGIVTVTLTEFSYLLGTVSEEPPATYVAQIGETKYATLAAAILAAQNGDTIEILDGTWGADAVGTMTTSESLSVRAKSLTIQAADGATPKFTNTILSLGYDDSSTTRNAAITVRGLAFENTMLLIGNYPQVTVEDCSFVGSNGNSSSAGALAIIESCASNYNRDEFILDQVTVRNCTFDGTNSGQPALRLRNSGNVLITGNTIANSKHNGILFESNGTVNTQVTKTVVVQNNTINEWNSTDEVEGGRGIRASLGTMASGSTVTISDNTFRKDPAGLDTPDFTKITGVGSATVDLSGNDWNDMLLSEVKGNSAIYTSDGTTTLASVVTTRKEPVAQIGETKYTSLAAAVEAVPTDGTETTIQMIADSAEAADIVIAASKNVVLDLNGKTVSRTVDVTSIYFLTNQGTLTVRDTSANAEGMILLTAQVDNGYSVENVTLLNEGGTLTLESGTVKNLTPGGLTYAVKNSSNAWASNVVSTFNMTGGVISAPQGDGALRVYQNTGVGWKVQSKNYVNISGGTILDTGIFFDTFLYTVNQTLPADFAANDTAVGCDIDTVVNISGGTINGLIDMKIRHPYNTRLNITGGTFAENRLRVRKVSNEYGSSLASGTLSEPTEPMLYISGGIFAAKTGTTDVFSLASNNGGNTWTSYEKPYAVSGGVFNVEVPATACADGYEPADNADAETKDAYPYTVGLLPVAQIVETGAKYFTLAAAVDAAQDGQTVKLLADAAQNDGIIFDKAGAGVILDLDGKTFTVNTGANCNNRAFRIDNGTLTVKNGSIVAAGSGTTSSNGAGCYGAFRVEKDGTLNVQDATLSNSRPWGLNVKICGGRANLERVTINSSYGGGIEVTEADLGASSQPGYAELTDCTFIQTGYFDHCSTALSVSGGSELVVNSGTYTSENYGIYVFSSGGRIVVKDGTFEGAGKAVVKAAMDTNTYPAYTGAVQISGGRFKGALDVTSPASMSISGGVFTAPVVAQYCASGYEPADNTDAATKDNYPYTVGKQLAVVDAATGTAEMSKALDGYTFKMAVSQNGGATVEESVDNPVIPAEKLPASGEYATYAFTAVKGGVETPVQNTVGILRVADAVASTNTVIAVPWQAFGDKIAIGSLVYLGNRSDGDQLMAYAANGTYYSWTLKVEGSTKTWTPDKTVKTGSEEAVEAPAASEFPISRGQGVFLKRINVKEPIYLVGRAPASGETVAATKTTLAASSESKPAWTLVAAPSTMDLDLNGDSSPFGSANASDTIMLVSAGGVAMKIPYTYSSKDGKWGRLVSKTVEETRANGKTVKYTYTERSTEGCTIPAGTGFWYLNKGGEKTVEW